MVKKTHRFRVLIVATLSMLAFVGIEARLWHVQVTQHTHYTRSAKAQHSKTITLNRRRGDILDRKGQVLATSTFFDSIYYNPGRVKGSLPRDLAQRMARLLEEPEDKIGGLLAKDKVTRIKSKVPPEVTDAMRLLEDDLNLPDGLIFYVKDSKRLYPKGDIAGPIVGFAGTDESGDNQGLEGVEREYDKELKGQEAQQQVTVNSWRQGLEPMDESAMGKTFGQTVELTIDSQIQHYTQKALRKRIGEVQAKAGAAIVMDTKTGELLAVALCPDFDPNDFSRARPDQRRNRTLTDPFEIGSVMKILTATILIDNNLLTPDEMVDCEDGLSFKYGRRIEDSHKIEGSVPFRIAFAESSNIAAAKLGLRLEPSLYYKSLRKFGLGDTLGVDLPGENGGLLRPVNQWTALSRTSLPMGYETSMTALQVVTAVSAVGNGGIRMKPHVVKRILSADGQVVKEFQPTEVMRVASPETCKTIINLMEGVVADGTGTTAQVPGYRVAGKTGTTKKQSSKHVYIASIIGMIPAENPRVTIYIFIDEPDPKIEYYGGKVAGPVFADIAKEVVRILGVPPSDEPAARKARDSANAKGGRGTPVAAASIEENIDGAEILTAKALALDARELASSWTPTNGANASVASDPSAAVRPGQMPRCLGLTMTEVIGLTARAEVPIQLFGTGIAVRQSPGPGVVLAKGQSAKIVFAAPSQKIEQEEPVAAAPEPDVKPASALPESLGEEATPEKGF